MRLNNYLVWEAKEYQNLRPLLKTNGVGSEKVLVRVRYLIFTFNILIQSKQTKYKNKGEF